MIFGSTPLIAQPKDFSHYGPRLDEQGVMNLSNFFEPNHLTVKEIKSQALQMDSYEAFLDFLTERRPQLLENYVLIHDTGSIQYADLERPRVLIFGDGLMLAFAEDPRTTDRSVEIIAFDQKLWKFTFDEIRFKGSSIQTVEAPSQCQSCHGAALKPLWEPYDFWPNAMGSSIGRFGSEAEKSAYEKLRKSKNQTGIYRRLRWYAPPVNNNSGLQGIEAFTQYVTQLQLLSSLRSWQQKSPKFAPFLPVVLAVLNDCTKGNTDQDSALLLETYLPTSFQGLIQKELPELHRKTKRERELFKDYQESRYRKLFPGANRIFAMDHQRLAEETQAAAQLKILFREMGLDFQDLTLSQGANPYLLSVPSNSEADFATNLMLIAPAFQAELQPTIRSLNDSGYAWLRFDCQILQNKSLAALERIQPLASPVPPSSAPTVFGECIRCHVLDRENTGAPLIPFDQSKELRQYLLSENQAGMKKIRQRLERSGPGRMPPDRRLSVGEKTDFLLNLQTILQESPQ